MIAPMNREDDLHLVNRASTTRNPRTGILEVHEGESEVARHAYVTPEEGGLQRCATCKFPAESMAHAVGTDDE